MKSGKIFFMFSVTLILVIWGGLLYDSTYVETKAFREQVKDHLTSVSQSRGERINDWLLEKENDVQVLAGLSRVKELMEENTSFSEMAIKLNVDQRSDIISREIENYIRAHPGMTLEALQNSAEFSSIAVRPIGRDGYTVLVDKQTSIAKFHKNPDFIEFDYDLVGKGNEEGVAILREAQVTNKDSSGFYNWLDPGGETRKKYAHFSVISAKTLDDFEFILATTAYLEDYQTIKNVPEDVDNYLKSFREIHDYHNIVLISTDGHLVYMAQGMEDFGGGLEWEENLNVGLAKNYQNTKRFNDISFFGPFTRHQGERFMKVSVMAPIYNEQSLLGFVGLIDDMEEPIEISTELTGLWDTGEVFLANEDELLITPLRFRYLDLLTQSVRTESLETCIYHIEEAEGVLHQEFYDFLNYRGDMTLGTYKPLPKIRWCVLAEIGEEEVFRIPVQSQIKGNVLVLVGTMFIAVIFVFYVGRFLDGKYTLKKRRLGKFFVKNKGDGRK